MAKRIKLKKIITIFLAVILGFGVITAGVFLLKPKETKRIHPTFHVGSIDEKTGKHVDSNIAIYSDAFECQGLRVEPDFSSNVKFNVFYYRFDESFIKDLSVINQTENYEAPDSDIIQYARIVIIPDGNTEKDFKIRFWEVGGISKDIKVFVNSTQTPAENLAEVKEDGKWTDNNGEITPDWQKLEPIDVSNIKDLRFVFESGIDNISDKVLYCFGDENGPSSGAVFNSFEITSKSDTLNVVDAERGDNNYLYIHVKNDVQLKIYKYN